MGQVEDQQNLRSQGSRALLGAIVVIHRPVGGHGLTFKDVALRKGRNGETPSHPLPGP